LRIKTPEGHVIPLDIVEGLPYLKVRPPTDRELATLEHCFFTSPTPWDPTVLDCNQSDDPTWYDAQEEDHDLIKDSNFNEFGFVKGRRVELHQRHPELQAHYADLMKEEGYESDEETFTTVATDKEIDKNR
jgi:hypothetical protein